MRVGSKIGPISLSLCRLPLCCCRSALHCGCNLCHCGHCQRSHAGYSSARGAQVRLQWLSQVLRGKLGATDFLIVHKGCVLAVEIDGEQHLEKPYKNQPQLDAAKDEAYWNAGINLLRLHHK